MSSNGGYRKAERPCQRCGHDQGQHEEELGRCYHVRCTCGGYAQPPEEPRRRS